MENKQSTLIMSASITFCYFLYKYLEYRFILKQDKPLKILFRETLVVFVSSMAGIFILDQLQPLSYVVSSSMPMVFMNDPDF